jgi:uncharacterized protein
VKIVDINILLVVTNTRAATHVPVKAWWDSAIRNEAEPIGLAWVAILGFVRISTNAKAYPQPLKVDQALEKVEKWIGHSNFRLVQETAQHAQIFSELMAATGTGGNLTTDAHLAALAISHNATLVSCDNDFARFRRLRWENPLAVP